MERSRYRRLRGFVRYVLPGVGWSYPPGRVLLNPRLLNLRVAPGRCTWCGLPLDNARERRWHRDCRRQFLACIGYVVRPASGEAPECAACGITKEELVRRAIREEDTDNRNMNLEIDHRYPIHAGREAGVKALIAAFDLDNIQYLCRPCHLAKTGDEQREAAARRRAADEASGKRRPARPAPIPPQALMEPLL